MATRKVIEAVDASSGELMYFKSHAKATYLNNGESVETHIISIDSSISDLRNDLDNLPPPEKGDKGDPGPQGPQGPQGEQGLQGNSGYTGAAGELEVVNNLFQGGEESALSAEQGKILGEIVQGFKPGEQIFEFAPSFTAAGSMQKNKFLENFQGHLKASLYITSNTTVNYSSTEPTKEKIILAFGSCAPGSVSTAGWGASKEITAVYGTQLNASTEPVIVYEADVTEPQDISVRHRCNGGSMKVIYSIGVSTNGLVQQVEQNTQRIEEVANITNAFNSRVSNIEEKLVDVDHKWDRLAEGKSSGSVSRVVESNVTKFVSAEIYAETDVTCTRDKRASFITVHAPNTGSGGLANEIYRREGDPGEVIKAGELIGTIGTTTFDSARDIVLGRYFTGTIRIKFDFGTTYGLETQVAINTEKIAALEGTGDNIVALHNEQIERAKQLGYLSVYSDTSGFYESTPSLTFMHISDSHSVKPNERAIQVLNYLGSNGHAKFLLHTGDMLVDPRSTSSKSWSDIVANAQYPVFVTSGNHDVGNWATPVSQQRNDEQFYNYFVAPQISKWNLKTDGGGTPHPTNKNYYFTDFSQERIRFIVTYEYEIPINESLQGDSATAAGRGARWISQEQTDWLIDTLATTPAGYGVILAHHAPEANIGSDRNPFNSSFRDKDNTQQSYQRNMSGVYYKSFFADIIQAFIERKSVSYQLVQTANAQYYNVLNVNANFTNVNSNVEFICHVSGHVHVDNISRIEGYPKQIELNINCSSTSTTGNQRSEVFLEEGTSFEDCINVYSINRKLGQIYVLRIGADYSSIGERKDMMTIDYRNGTYSTVNADEIADLKTISPRVDVLESNVSNMNSKLSSIENAVNLREISTTYGGESYQYGAFAHTSTVLGQEVQFIHKSTSEVGGSYKCMQVEVKNGDKITVSGAGGNAYRLYSLVDNTNILRVMAAPDTRTTGQTFYAECDGTLYATADTYTAGVPTFQIIITRSVSDIPSADIEDDIVHLNDSVNDINKKISFLDSSYQIIDLKPISSHGAYTFSDVTVGNKTVVTFGANGAFRCVRSAVYAGDVISLSGVGGGNARLYCLMDRDYKIVKIAGAGAETGGSIIDIDVEVDGSMVCSFDINANSNYSISIKRPENKIKEIENRLNKVDGAYEFGRNCDCNYTDTGVDAWVFPSGSLVNSIYGWYDELVSEFPRYVSRENCDNVAESIGISKPSSISDLPMYMYKFIPPRTPNDPAMSATSSSVNRLKVLILTGTHPEYAGIWGCLNAMRAICRKWKDDSNLEELRWNADIYIMPCFNMYGVENRSRTNENGVNLNRNAPTQSWVLLQKDTENYTGDMPGSEYSTKVLMHYMRTLSPNVFIDHHNTTVGSGNDEGDGKNLIYSNCANQIGIDVAGTLISHMTRKWKQRYTEIFPSVDDDPVTLYGFVMNDDINGSLGRYASEQGILGSTYECNMGTLYKNGTYSTDNRTLYTSEIMTCATEGFVNYLVRMLKAYSEHIGK